MRTLHFLSTSLLALVSLSCAVSKRTPSKIPPVAPMGLDVPPTHRLDHETLQNERLDPQEKKTNVTSAKTVVAGDVVVDLEKLVGKELLFNSDLQFTSDGDEEDGFAAGYQSIVLGHKIAKMEVVGSQVLVTADESVNAESEFPRPELIATFDILSRTTDGKAVLRPTDLGHTSMVLYGEKTDTARKSWLRSISFDPNGSYLLMEVSTYGDKGAVFHFMESIFPRENVVAGTSAIRPDEATDVFSTLLHRIGIFLNSAWFVTDTEMDNLENVTKTEKSAVLRYDISEQKTIDWYVTQNLPDTLLPEIKAGIEGWNRYFNEFRPEKPVMVFKGKLPDGVKLGDPRFNVVNFDAVADAGAAYESQANDPLTGVQSHSLIYMPFAWYNIGTAAWIKDIENTQPSSFAYSAAVSRKQSDGKIKSLFANKIARCDRSLNFNEEIEHLMADGRTTSEEAGRALMRSTLLHEVGHALGMEHNFKGSLVGNTEQRTSDAWMYSSSVMDYNAPTIEDSQLFTDMNPDRSARDVTKGKVLPYDDQFIDILYNEGKRVEANPASFPVMATCNDDQADDRINGMDPLCVRYDFFASTLDALSIAQERVSTNSDYLAAKRGGFITLKGHLSNLDSNYRTEFAKAVEEQQDFETLQKLTSDVSKDAIGALVYLVSGSKISHRRALLLNLDLLGEWKSFPETDSADEPFTAESVDAQLSGHVQLGALVPGLIKADKTFDIGVWTTYQQRVQFELAVGVQTAMRSGPTDKGLDVYGFYKSGRDRVLQSLEGFKAVAMTGAKTPAEKEAVTAAHLKATKLLETALAGVLSKYQVSISTLLPSGGTIIAKDTQSEVRPILTVETSTIVFDATLVLARRSEATNESREGAVAVLKGIYGRKKGWDATTTRLSRQMSLNGVKSDMTKELGVLEKKRTSANYLTETEKLRMESLAKMIKTITETLDKE